MIVSLIYCGMIWWCLLVMMAVVWNGMMCHPPRHTPQHPHPATPPAPHASPTPHPTPHHPHHHTHIHTTTHTPPATHLASTQPPFSYLPVHTAAPRLPAVFYPPQFIHVHLARALPLVPCLPLTGSGFTAVAVLRWALYTTTYYTTCSHRRLRLHAQVPLLYCRITHRMRTTAQVVTSTLQNTTHTTTACTLPLHLRSHTTTFRARCRVAFISAAFTTTTCRTPRICSHLRSTYRTAALAAPVVARGLLSSPAVPYRPAHAGLLDALPAYDAIPGCGVAPPQQYRSALLI